MRCWLLASGSGSGCAERGPCCHVPVFLVSACSLSKPTVCVLATNEIGSEEERAAAVESLLVEQTVELLGW